MPLIPLTLPSPIEQMQIAGAVLFVCLLLMSSLVYTFELQHQMEMKELQRRLDRAEKRNGTKEK